MPRLLRALQASVCAAVCASLLAAVPATASEINEWRDLSGQRGVVVLMRHALASGGGDPTGFRLGDCRTQRNLSLEGRAQARSIGADIKRSGLDIHAVLSSPWCRAKDTASLLDLGPIQTLPYLGSTFTAPQSVSDAREARTRRLITSHRGREGVLILVGHYANIMELTGQAVDSGESLIVRTSQGGVIDVMGHLPAPGVSSRSGN